MPSADPYRSALEALDRLEEELSDWEAGFLETCLKWRGTYTAKQQAVIVKLCERYARFDLAAECLGQTRLLERT